MSEHSLVRQLFNRLTEVASEVTEIKIEVISNGRRLSALEEHYSRLRRSDPPRSLGRYQSDTGTHFVIPASDMPKLFERFEERQAAGRWADLVAFLGKVAVPVVSGGVTAALVALLTLWFAHH